jgi:DNA replication protein DnaC
VSAPADTLIGRCACGAEVTRDLAGATGFLRDMAARLPFVCDACIETATASEQDAERRRDQALRDRRRQARITASGVPGALLNITFDDLDHHGRERIIAAALRWAVGDLAGLVLTGPVGAGKTRIAAAAANEMLCRRALRWTSAPLLFARLGHGFGTDGHEGALDVLIGAHPLILDDLDKVRPTEFAAERVFAAIDTRITEGVPLLVTTNLGSAQLAEKFPDPFGEAITSRLAGYCEGHRVDGPDRRLQPTHEEGGPR